MSVKLAGSSSLSRASSALTSRSLARLLVPDIADYRAAFRLALIPAVGLIIATSFLHNAALSMRFSFYVVYLESVGMAGTVIGFLVGVASLDLAGAFDTVDYTLLTEKLEKRVESPN